MKRFIVFIVFLLVLTIQEDASAKTERLIVFEEGILEHITSSSLYNDQIHLQRLDDQIALATFDDSLQQTFTTCDTVLRQSPFIHTVEIDQTRSIDESVFSHPNDQLAAEQWWIDRLNMPEVWAIGQHYAKQEAKIAVIDSGVNRQHPDLQDARILPGFDFITNTSADVDLNGHGTAIIGLLRATTNNGEGISSLLHEYPVNILPLRIMDEKGITKISSIVQAIDFAINDEVDVINLSLGGAMPSEAEKIAVQKAIDKGIIVVASAGNDAMKGNPMNYPAAYPNVIGVGALTPDNQRAPFSNVHNYVDFIAPGTKLLTTDKQQGYTTLQGTSFSTPFVSALASMIRSIDASATRDMIYQTLQQTAQPLSDEVPSKEYGYGAVQFVEALQTFSQNLPTVIWSTDNWQLPIEAETKWLELDEHHYAILLEVGETVNFRETMTLTTNQSPIITINGQQLRANAVGSTRFKLYQLNGPTKTIDVKVTENRQHTLAGFTKEDASWQVTPTEKASLHPEGLIHLARPGNVQVQVQAEGKSQQFNKQISGQGLPADDMPHEILRPKHSKDQLTLLFNEDIDETFVKKCIELSTDEWNEHPWDHVDMTLKDKKVFITPKKQWPDTPIFIHVHDATLNDKPLNNPQIFYFKTR